MKNSKTYLQLGVLLAISGGLSMYFATIGEANFQPQAQTQAVSQFQNQQNQVGVPSKVTVNIVEGASNKNNDQFYVPKEITIKSGGTVTWENNDKAAHTATGNNDQFDSGIISPSQSFSTTLSSSGTVNYHCSIHPWMKGTIHVK